MRILITSDTALPAIGGAEMHVENMKKALSSIGCETLLFTTQDGKDVLGTRRHVWDRKFLSLYRDLDRTIVNFRPDIISAHYSFRLAMVAGLIGRFRKIPMTVTLHGLGILPPAHPTFRGRIQHAFYRRLSLIFASKVISTSEDLATVARRYVSPKKIIVISNGASAKDFSRDVLARDPRTIALRKQFFGKKVILTVRRLNPKCGIQYLVEALPTIIKKHPNLLYVMIGTGRLEAKLKVRIRELGVEENVLMMGALSNGEVAPYFATADLAIFPSTAESTSISCIESMMAGCPIVASRVGGLIELIGAHNERGRLVRIVGDEYSNYAAPTVDNLFEGAIDRLAEAVSGLLSDSDSRERLSDKAFSYAIRNFDWRILAERTLDVFREAINKRSSHRSGACAE